MTSFSSLLYFEIDYSLWSDSATLWCLLGVFFKWKWSMQSVCSLLILLFYKCFLMAVYVYDVADYNMGLGEATFEK